MARTPWLALLATLTLAAPAQALPQGNVVVNGDAEGSPGATNFSTIAPPAGWTTSGQLTAITYTADGAPIPPAEGGGAQFFSGGGTPESRGTQRIDLSAYAAEIDSQAAQANLSAALGGFSGQGDAAQAVVRFLAGDEQELAQMFVGPVTVADRQSQSTLLTRTATAAVPVGTRSVEVAILAVRVGGDSNDGYADNVSLTFGPRPQPQSTPLPPQTATLPPAPAFGPQGVFSGLPPATKCLSKRRFTINVRNRGRTWETVLVVLDGKRLKVRKPSRRTRNHYSSLIDLRGFPKRKVVVRLTAVSTTGEVIAGKRKYHTCESFKRKSKKNRL
jgi:hypothetical protein